MVFCKEFRQYLDCLNLKKAISKYFFSWDQIWPQLTFFPIIKIHRHLWVNKIFSGGWRSFVISLVNIWIVLIWKKRFLSIFQLGSNLTPSELFSDHKILRYLWINNIFSGGWRSFVISFVNIWIVLVLNNRCLSIFSVRVKFEPNWLFVRSLKFFIICE